MQIEEIEKKIRAFLTDELEIDESRIHEDSRLKEDMGIDSLELVDVAVLVDREFGFKMKPEEFRPLKTYGQFCSFILEKANS